MTYLIVAITICCTIFSYKLLQKAAGTMSILKLNTVSYVFYFQIITSALVGSMLLAIGVIDYHPYAEPLSYETKIEAWIWTMYSILTLPLGMLLINRITKVYAKKDFNEYLLKDLNLKGTVVGNKMIVLGMALFCIGTLAYIVLNTGEIPLRTILTGGDLELAAEQRVTAKLNFKGIVYIRSFFGLILMPVFAYYTYIVLRLKKEPFYLAMFFVCFMCTAFLLVLDIQKAPIAFFMMGFILCEVFISKGLDMKKAILFIGLPVLLLLLGYQLTTEGTAFDQLFRFNSAFYGRTFLSGYFGFPLSLEFFPDIITEQTHTAGIPRFFQDSDFQESARLIMIQMNPEGVKAGTANLFSSYYLGEAWANYGYVGLVVSPFVVGAVIQGVHVWLIRSAKNPLIIAFYALITTRWLVSAGVSSFLYLKIILFPIVLYFIVRFILNKVAKTGA